MYSRSVTQNSFFNGYSSSMWAPSVALLTFQRYSSSRQRFGVFHESLTLIVCGVSDAAHFWWLHCWHFAWHDSKKIINRFQSGLAIDVATSADLPVRKPLVTEIYYNIFEMGKSAILLKYNFSVFFKSTPAVFTLYLNDRVKLFTPQNALNFFSNHHFMCWVFFV